MDITVGPTMASPSVEPMIPSGPFGPTSPPSIQGDPATRRFGMIFFLVLAAATIGSIIGIGVGNIAHYRYFGPVDSTNTSNDSTAFNFIQEDNNIGQIASRLASPLSRSLLKKRYFTSMEDTEKTDLSSFGADYQ